MKSLAEHWGLDPTIVFLNHGSFGASPRAVLAHQSNLRAQLEAEPVRFFVREYPKLLDAAREALAAFLGAAPSDLVFVPNATTGVNAVLRSLRFSAGDEILCTDQEYNACRNVLNFVAENSGARVVVAKLPFPLRDPSEVTQAVVARVTPKTRLLFLDHVVSQTGIVLPVAAIIARLQDLGVSTFIDGAHAPGMLPLDLKNLGAAYYTGNCHKWICTPKGAAFLYVRHDLQHQIRPTTISHGANAPTTRRSRFLQEFDWTGTGDPTAVLCIPKALEYMASLVEGGWSAIMKRNHALAIEGRSLLCERLKLPYLAPESMIGTLAAISLPDAEPPASAFDTDPLQDRLFHEFRIEVPVMPGPILNTRFLRISAQLHNSIRDYERLADALAVVCPN